MVSPISNTAPIYGFGSAERDLAPVLAAEPKLTVATKVGLYPPGGGEQTGAVVFARKVLGKLYPPLSRVHVDLSVKTAEVSLDASLKRLQRERLDILFIHEPDCTRIETEEWHRWLERERERGRLIAFGIAGAMAQIEPLVSESARSSYPDDRQYQRSQGRSRARRKSTASDNVRVPLRSTQVRRSLRATAIAN